jgi:endonuclease-8
VPEGHTTHRLARGHRAALAGRRVDVSSPQGRFAGGAAMLDGRLLEDVEAYGKHLFYRFEGEAVLHVHLGLVGVFRTHTPTAPPAGGSVRLRLASAEAGVAVDLSGPMRCELLDPDEAARIVAPLGPDPLRPGADARRARAALERRPRLAIGAALLDQHVLAGVGNVFRAESLFVCGVHPDRPARSVADDGFDELWRTLRRMLRQGVRSGRIVTVDPADVGASSRARVPDAERVYVYRRAGDGCRRCATTVGSWSLGGRLIFACARCQPPT